MTANTRLESRMSGQTSRVQIPALLNNLPDYYPYRLLDFGCGRNWPAIEKHLRVKKCKPVGYGPYWLPNVSLEWLMVLKNWAEFEVITCCNVLNVQPDDEHIEDIVQTFLQDLAGPETLVYFQVYERNKSGIVERTRDGYQQNKPLDAYFKAIQKYGVIAGVNRGKHYASCKKHRVQRVSSLSPVKTSV